MRKVQDLKREQETSRLAVSATFAQCPSRVSHFAQAECPLGAFCLCTPGLDAVQMDDTDSKLRRCKLSGGRKCLRHSIAVPPVHHIQLLSNVTVATFRSNFPQ